MNDASATLVGNNLARTDFAQRFSRQPDHSPRTTEQSSTAGAPSSSQRYQLSATSFFKRQMDAEHAANDAENEALRARRGLPRADLLQARPAILTTSVGASSSYHQGQSPLRRRTDVTMGEDELRTPRTRVSRHQVGSFGHHVGSNQSPIGARPDLFGGTSSGYSSHEIALRSSSAHLCKSDDIKREPASWAPARSDPGYYGARPQDNVLW